LRVLFQEFLCDDQRLPIWNWKTNGAVELCPHRLIEANVSPLWTDNRQAVFEVRLGGIHAVFVDHGHMFSGPDGISVQPNYRASAYLDRRIYEPHSKMARTTPALDVDSLWTRAKQMPIEWLTDTALRSLSKCLGVLADEKKLQAIF
jgi:hypothetical protein